jgi:hypothetical protein
MNLDIKEALLLQSVVNEAARKESQLMLKRGGGEDRTYWQLKGMSARLSRVIRGKQSYKKQVKKGER